MTKLEQVKIRAILLTLAEANGNQRLAAKLLGTSRSTIYRTLKKYNSVPQERPHEDRSSLPRS